MDPTTLVPPPVRTFWQLTALVDAHGSDGHPYTVLAQTRHTDAPAPAEMHTNSPTQRLLTGDGHALDRLAHGRYRLRQSDITLISDDPWAP